MRGPRPFLTWLPLALLLAAAGPVAAQAGGSSAAAAPLGTVTRVLVVGDSWAERMWTNRSLATAFAANGRPDIVEEGGLTALSGTTAAEWAQPSMLQLLTDELDRHPTVDVVQLTIGGNDVLAGEPDGWWTGMTPTQEEALFVRVETDLLTVADHVLAHDPQLQVVVSLYDYPNFVESLSGILFFLCVPVHQGLGEPTPFELNDAELRLQDRLDAAIAPRPRVWSVRHFGLMQYLYGFPGQGIPPGQLLPPGDPARPSPIDAMALGADCFHLRGVGYDALAQNLWEGFYGDYFAGVVFADGFESGGLGAWSTAVEARRPAD